MKKKLNWRDDVIFFVIIFSLEKDEMASLCKVCGVKVKCDGGPRCFDNLKYVGNVLNVSDYFTHKPWVYPITLKCGHVYSRHSLFEMTDGYSPTEYEVLTCIQCNASETMKPGEELKSMPFLLGLVDDLQVFF